MALVNSITFFHTLRQHRDESIENYRRRFESAWNSATMNKACLGQHPDFNTYVVDQGSSVTSNKDIEEKLCATYFITFADPGRFGGLWENLSNSTLLGRDDYPANITAAYDLLCHYRGGKRQNTHDTPVNVSFAQIRQADDNLPPVPGSNGELIPDMTCWKCLRLGHLSRHCPERVKIGGVQHVQWTQFAHSPSNIVPKNWLLLDSGSTISSVCNKDLLHNIVKVHEPVRVFTNGGSQDYSERGTLNIINLMRTSIQHLWQTSYHYRKFQKHIESLWIPVHLLPLPCISMTVLLYFFQSVDPVFTIMILSLQNL